MAVSKERKDGVNIQGDAEGDDGQSTLSTDEVYSLLSNERRRLVISLLSDKGQEVEMRDITTQVACIETGSRTDTVSSKERKRTHVSLYQCHLPKLDEAGVIDWDKDRGWIAPGPHLSEVANQHTKCQGSLLDCIKVSLEKLL